MLTTTVTAMFWMRPARLLCVFTMAIACLGATGCSQNLAGSMRPGVDLHSYKTMHVYMFDDDEETDVSTSLQQQLRGRGFVVTGGLKSAAPPDVEVLVQAYDKWFWDITMYLIEFKVEFLDAESGRPLAEGYSYRTSLARKGADYMVWETLAEIFDDPEDANYRSPGRTGETKRRR